MLTILFDDMSIKEKAKLLGAVDYDFVEYMGGHKAFPQPKLCQIRTKYTKIIFYWKPIVKPQCLYCSNRTLTFRNVCVWNFGTVEPFRYNLLSLLYCFSYIYYK